MLPFTRKHNIVKCYFIRWTGQLQYIAAYLKRMDVLLCSACEIEVICPTIHTYSFRGEQKGPYSTWLQEVKNYIITVSWEPCRARIFQHHTNLMSVTSCIESSCMYKGIALGKWHLSDTGRSTKARQSVTWLQRPLLAYYRESFSSVHESVHTYHP